MNKKQEAAMEALNDAFPHGWVFGTIRGKDDDNTFVSTRWNCSFPTAVGLAETLKHDLMTQRSAPENTPEEGEEEESEL